MVVNSQRQKISEYKSYFGDDAHQNFKKSVTNNKYKTPDKLTSFLPTEPKDLSVKNKRIKDEKSFKRSKKTKKNVETFSLNGDWFMDDEFALF